MILKNGTWLGIDVGSARNKVCNFCLIESDGSGLPKVFFERGPAKDPYPKKNAYKELISIDNRGTYLADAAEEGVKCVLENSQLLDRWLGLSKDRPSAVAVDAPVAFAQQEGSCRLTEAACTQSFETPTQAKFGAQLNQKADSFLRINAFWKCVGFAVYRHLATKIGRDSRNASPKTIAALTCDKGSDTPRLREAFPSDVYERANGFLDRTINGYSILSDEARNVLKQLVAVEWKPVKGYSPASQTMTRLNTIRDFLSLDLEHDRSHERRLCEMRKRNGITGDLWDAFTCAFTACCEDHGGAEFHGMDDGPNERLRAEGAILTVRRKIQSAG